MAKKQQKWWIPELPTPIILEILSRLPVESIFNCRRVCKEWLSLFSDPHFVNLHLSRSPAVLLLKPIYQNRFSNQYRLIDLQKPLVKGCCYSRDSQLKLKPGINIPSPAGGTRIMNSCNGLLVLTSCYLCFICNPVLGEFFSISLPHTVEPDDTIAFLGFISRTNQYKVVQFFHELDSDEVLARIYTFGEKLWKELGHIPYPLTNRSFNALVNGGFHWLVSDEATTELIHCFDFDKELLVVVPEPLKFGSCDEEVLNWLWIGVLDDCLVLCDSSNILQINVWVMREYGVKESWRREFAFRNSICIMARSDYFEFVTVLRSGEVVLLYNMKSLLLHNPKGPDGVGFKRLKIHGVRSDFQAIAHVPSFVSLNDVAKGEDVQSTLDRRIYLAEKAARGSM